MKILVASDGSQGGMAAVRFAARQADFVIHLAGTLYPVGKNSYWAANAETTEAVAMALTPSRARRVLFLSYVGAAEGSANTYLHLKARAERLLAGTGKEVVVFRCSHIIGSPDAPGPTASAILARPGKPVHVLGNGLQMVAPLYVGDAVSALLAAIRQGSPGVYDLTGPERMTMDGLVRLINRNPAVPITHYPAWFARVLSRFVPALPAPFVDVMAKDSVGDPSRAVASFGLKLTSLRTVWNELPANVPPHTGAVPAQGYAR